MWTPGVRAGVKPLSEYHLTEYFGPILGVMHADPLGLGPIQAARADLDGARMTRDYATQWFDGTGLPSNRKIGRASCRERV